MQHSADQRLFEPKAANYNDGSFGEEEAGLRVDLAALYRLLNHFGWTDTIYTHISMSVPGENAFLLNPFGVLFEEVTASSLVKVDIDGNVINDPSGLGVNKAGFVIHGAVHSARPDISCVIHTHTPAGVAVSAQEAGLLPISQHAAMLLGRIGYHDFEGIAMRRDEQRRLADNLGSNQVLILRNHGMLITGRNPGEAFALTSILERACEIQVLAMSGGHPLRTISTASITETQSILDSAEVDFSRDWAAMLRLADRLDPGFRN